MRKYKVNITWSGYSRGESTYIIKADSEDEARELYYEGDRVTHSVVRDDTENEIETIKEIKEDLNV